MSIIKRLPRSALVGVAGIMVMAAVLAGWMVTHQTARAAGPRNDYPWANAADCSQQFGIFSWCLNGSDMSPLRFGYRNCTDYAAYELNEQMGGSLSNLKFKWADINVKTAAFPQGDGNAFEWRQGTINHFGADRVNHTPAVGAVAWWGPEAGHGFGHVGIVANVSPDQKTIVVYSYNAYGTGSFSADPISKTTTQWPNWPDAFLHIADISGGSDYGSPSDYASKIVQWDNGPNAQKTAWLVSPDLKRYWIPDSSTFNCLRNSGFALAGTLPAYLLDQLPDQKDHWARCGSDTLGANQLLFRGSSLVSSNGQFHLELQRSDGNLVLYGPTGAARWANTASSDYLVMQPDGNLVTYSYKGGVTWSSNTAGIGVDHLVLTNDGNLGLYTAGNILKWTTLFDSRPVAGVATFTPTPSPKPHPTATFTPTPTPVPSHAVNAYDNYGTANWVGHAMCRGNPSNSLSMPGGTASQTFTVPSGVASLSGAMVQIDPDSTVTAHLSVLVNGSLAATTTALAAGDTHFSFGPVQVSPGDTVTVSITFSATYGKIITVYTVGAPGGMFTASNSCPDGAPSLSTTSTGLRAVVSGMS